MKVGDEIERELDDMSDIWIPGRIIRSDANGVVVDVAYDDGTDESNVPLEEVRLRHVLMSDDKPYKTVALVQEETIKSPEPQAVSAIQQPRLPRASKNDLATKFEEFELRMSALRKSAEDAHTQLQDVRDFVKEVTEKPPKYAEDGIIIYDACPYGHSRILYGNLIWASGVALSKFLMWWQSRLARASNAKQMTNMSVLELGTGTGVVSLVLGRLGAKVIASDGDSAILDTLKRNIEANGLQEQIAPHLLSFGVAETYLTDRSFDLIVAADVIYETGSQGERLASALDAHVPTGSSAEVILAHEVRENVPLHFFDHMQRHGFNIERLEDGLGNAAGVPAGQPWTAYDDAQFVVLQSSPDSSMCTPGARGTLSWLVLNAVFSSRNTGCIQLFRLTRSW